MCVLLSTKLPEDDAQYEIVTMLQPSFTFPVEIRSHLYLGLSSILQQMHSAPTNSQVIKYGWHSLTPAGNHSRKEIITETERLVNRTPPEILQFRDIHNFFTFEVF
jgi:hypothetical protein